MNAHEGLHLVDVVFVGALIIITIIAFWLRYVVAEMRFRSILEVYGMLAITSSMTMGVIAVWAAFDEEVAGHLPINWMIVSAGLVAVFWGGAKIIDPLFNRDPGAGETEGDRIEAPEHDENIAELKRLAA